jgi:hypothetical protein
VASTANNDSEVQQRVCVTTSMKILLLHPWLFGTAASCLFDQNRQLDREQILVYKTSSVSAKAVRLRLQPLNGVGKGKGKGDAGGGGAVNRKPTFLGHIFDLDGMLNLLTHGEPFVSISISCCTVKMQ